MWVTCLPWHVPLSPIQSFTALPLKSQLSPSWILNMHIWCLSTAPWTVSVSVDGHYLWVIFMKNSGTLINSLLMIASPSLATVLVIIITNSHLNMLLIETSPVGGSTKFLNRRIWIRSAFIIQSCLNSKTNANVQNFRFIITCQKSRAYNLTEWEQLNEWSKWLSMTVLIFT